VTTPPGEGGERRVPRWGVGIALLGVQVVVMLAVFTPTPHNGGDNAGYLSLAHALLQGHGYVELWDPAHPPHTKYPPVFPLVLAAAMAAGVRSWVGFKALSLLFTTASVLLAFLWVLRRRGVLFAGGVALLLAVSDALLWSSRWILSEPLFLVLTFLALWAVERGEEEPSRVGWLWVGGAAAILAYLTRSAGLPLVVAVAGFLLLRRRFRAAAVFGAAFALPALGWWLHSRRAPDAYLSEFWLLDPYDPEAGRVGMGGLALRVWENLGLYATLYIPGGITGVTGRLVAAAGILLTLLALVGWVRRLPRPGPAELFVPLYAGIILLWPVVWSGDRFALPLYLFVLFYAGEVVVDSAGRWGRQAAGWVGGGALLLLALPALVVWNGAVGAAAECRALSREEGPWSCHDAATREWVASGLWSGARLPEGSLVLSRKPRLFYVVSGGVESLNYPMVRAPGFFLDFARERGARYVVLDYLDVVGSSYLVPVLLEKPGAFCTIAGWGPPEEARTELLGILPEGGEGGGSAGEDEVVLDPCPPEMVLELPRSGADYSSPRVPLLRAMDR